MKLPEIIYCPECDGNYMGRRQVAVKDSCGDFDVSIQFECEYCGYLGSLHFLRHKGETLLKWRKAGR